VGIGIKVAVSIVSITTIIAPIATMVIMAITVAVAAVPPAIVPGKCAAGSCDRGESCGRERDYNELLDDVLGHQSSPGAIRRSVNRSVVDAARAPKRLSLASIKMFAADAMDKYELVIGHAMCALIARKRSEGRGAITIVA
jgi:hypothetical protein